MKKIIFLSFFLFLVITGKAQQNDTSTITPKLVYLNQTGGSVFLNKSSNLSPSNVRIVSLQRIPADDQLLPCSSLLPDNPIQPTNPRDPWDPFPQIPIDVNCPDFPPIIEPPVVNPPDPYTVVPASIPASGMVTPSGAYQYTVPIEIPSGIGGEQPNLSLIYNSQSGYGLAGYGWSLSGLSSFTPTNGTIYHDGEVYQSYLIGFKTTFHNCYLDGQRLVPTTDTDIYPNKKIYTLESNNTIRIEAELNSTLYFMIGNVTVKMPNGTVYKYIANDYLSKKISKIEYSSGNYIDFIYNSNSESAQNYIQEIKYGGNLKKGTGHYASVKFSYINNPKKSVFYISNGKYKNSLLLSSIESLVHNKSYRTYSLSYNNGYYAQLFNIIVKSGLSKLSPIFFHYGSGISNDLVKLTDVTVSPYYKNMTHRNMIAQSGRYSYYEKEDEIIVLPYKEPNYLENGRFSSDYDPTDKLLIYSDFNYGMSLAREMPVGKGFVGVVTANIDNSPEREVIMINSIPGGFSYNSVPEQLSLKVCSPSLYGGIAVKKTFNYSIRNIWKWGTGNVGTPYYYNSVTPKKFIAGDFNGDGIEEILAVERAHMFHDGNYNYHQALTYIFDISGNETSPVFAEEVLCMTKNDILFALDFDGDGKTDLALINDEGIHIYSFVKRNNKNAKWAYDLVKQISSNCLKLSDLNGIVSGGVVFARTLLVGDINGDGKTDLLVTARCGKKGDGTYTIYGNENKWKQLTMTGMEIESSEYTLVACNADGGAFLQDMNGDGRADLIDRNGKAINIYYSDGEIISKTNSKTINTTTSAGIITTIDALHPNNNRFIAHIEDSKLTRYNFQRDENQESLLTQTSSSIEVQTKIEYDRLGGLNSGQNIYSSDFTAQYPYRTLTEGNLWMTKKVSTLLSMDEVSSNSYFYSNAVFHLQGLGFCGFKLIESYDNIRGHKTVQTFDPLRKGVLLTSDSPLQSVENIWTVDIVGNHKEVKARLQSQVEKNKLTGNTINTKYTYDGYGLPTVIERSTGGVAEKTINTYLNKTDGGRWLVGLPLTTEVEKTRNGNTVKAKTTISYDDQYFVNKKISTMNGNQVSEESFTYDNFGNPLTISAKAYNSSDLLSTQYTYSPDGRFVIKETTPLGLSTLLEYDNNKGVIVKQTDHKNNVINYEYDDFALLKTTKYPDGVKESVSIQSVYSPNNAKISKLIERTGAPKLTMYYDALGREVAQSKEGFDGSLIWTTIKHNTKSEVIETAGPYTGNPSCITKNSYDSYGRLTKVEGWTGKVITYNYSGASVTENNAGLSSTKTYNALGEIVSITDPAGTITYNYRADGQPSSIVAPGGVTTSFEYDTYGRQTKIIDPSAGVVTYEYDAYGNISKQTNANNKAISFVYDKFGLLKSKTTPEFSTTYTYNTDYLPSTVISSNGTSQAFTYDNLLRVTKQTDKVDNIELSKSFIYGNARVSAITYNGPVANKSINYTHNAYGYLSEIKFDNASIWKANQINTLGQLEKATLGNGTEITRSYAPNGLPQTIKTMKGTSTLQNYSYVFDGAKGLLNSRTDGINNKTENFGYDNMLRLTSYASSNVAYNNMGNITSKTDAGTMLYNVANKPYAIGELKENQGSVPPRLQEISYTSFNRPAVITENGYKAEFVYNDAYDRAQMKLSLNNNLQFTRYYLDNCYEKEVNSNNSIKAERLYLGGSPYNAPAVYSKENNVWKLYYLHRDYLGNITQITDENGAKVAEYSYDAWGRLRNPTTQVAYLPGQEPELKFNRGYTGHEHLPWFGLVNMNARLYDPVLGRFLAADPYVQAPDWSQNFNRYSYAMNNPLMYVDENGEAWWLIPAIAAAVFATGNTAAHWIRGDIRDIGDAFKYFGQGALAGAALGTMYQFAPLLPLGNILRTGMDAYCLINGGAAGLGIVGDVMNGLQNGNWGFNSLKVLLGNFYIDENASFFEGVKQGISIHTWEFDNTTAGNLYSHHRNLMGKTSRVDYFGGATFSTNENSDSNDGVTLGSFINMNIKGRIERSFDEHVVNSPLYMHEFGHTLQSRSFGFSYLFVIAIPSGISAWADKLNKTNYHRTRWYEMQSNRWAASYFGKYYNVVWNFENFPRNR